MERRAHIVSAYEEDLSSLNSKIAKMGGLAEQVVGQSLAALEKRDRTLAERTIEQDQAIDRLEAEIENDVGVMIVKRQPVAYDLRQVMAPLRIATDLERIGPAISPRLLCLCSPAGRKSFSKKLAFPVATRTTSPPPLDEEAEAVFVAKVKALAPKYRTELLPRKTRTLYTA